MPALFKYYINDMHRIFENDAYDPLILENHKVVSLSFADDLVTLSNTHKALINMNQIAAIYSFQLMFNNKSYGFSGKIWTILNFYFNYVSIQETKEYNFLDNRDICLCINLPI